MLLRPFTFDPIYWYLREVSLEDAAHAASVALRHPLVKLKRIVCSWYPLVRIMRKSRFSCSRLRLSPPLFLSPFMYFARVSGMNVGFECAMPDPVKESMPALAGTSKHVCIHACMCVYVIC